MFLKYVIYDCYDSISLLLFDWVPTNLISCGSRNGETSTSHVLADDERARLVCVCVCVCVCEQFESKRDKVTNLARLFSAVHTCYLYARPKLIGSCENLARSWRCFLASMQPGSP